MYTAVIRAHMSPLYFYLHEPSTKLTRDKEHMIVVPFAVECSLPQTPKSS
jgi:hypothetical protein